MDVDKWLVLVVVARLAAAFVNIVHDCDEVYNYWEPLHYLLHGSGMQTWEYRCAAHARYRCSPALGRPEFRQCAEAQLVCPCQQPVLAQFYNSPLSTHSHMHPRRVRPRPAWAAHATTTTATRTQLRLGTRALADGALDVVDSVLRGAANLVADALRVARGVGAADLSLDVLRRVLGRSVRALGRLLRAARHVLGGALGAVCTACTL